jgi:hypothetical protein
VLLGWKPSEFWDATPTELACILRALLPKNAEPLVLADIAKLKELFPDG